jgi:hypothetical protein
MIISSPPYHDCNRENAYAGHIQGVFMRRRCPARSKKFPCTREHAGAVRTKVPCIEHVRTPANFYPTISQEQVHNAFNYVHARWVCGGWRGGRREERRGGKRGRFRGLHRGGHRWLCRVGRMSTRSSSAAVAAKDDPTQRRGGDDDTIDGSESNQQSTNDVNWRGGGATGRQHGGTRTCTQQSNRSRGRGGSR